MDISCENGSNIARQEAKQAPETKAFIKSNILIYKVKTKRFFCFFVWRRLSTKKGGVAMYFCHIALITDTITDAPPIIIPGVQA